MKQTKALIIMALLLLCGAAMAAESGITAPRKETKKRGNEEQTRKYEVAPFDRIDCATIANIYLVQGNETSVEARLHTGSLELLDVSVEDRCLKITNVSRARYDNQYSVDPQGRLYFGQLDGEHSRQQSVDFYITTPSVSQITLDGASRLNVKSLNVPKLSIKVSAISAITVQNLVCNYARLEMAGAYSCDINATGDCLTLSGSGVGKTRLKFKGGVLKISNSGAGSVKAEVDCQELQAENAGCGKITLKGTADHTSIESSGASTIDTKQLNQY